MAFRVLIIGGTGQVGSSVVKACLAEPTCSEVVMINRRSALRSTDPRVREVVLDTSAPEFSDEVAVVAKALVALDDPVSAVSCVGVGSGSMKWTEDQLKALEVGVAGGFARGCHAGGISHFSLLSAVGSSSSSRFRYVRVMGLKEEAVEAVGFKRLAIFQPGIIAGNAHTPGYVVWLGRLVPGRFGVVEQDEIGRAFVAEFKRGSAGSGTARYENREMKSAS